MSNFLTGTPNKPKIPTLFLSVFSTPQSVAAIISHRSLFKLYPTTIKSISTIAPSFIRNSMSASDQSLDFNISRLVTKKVLAKLQLEGDGAVVRRGIGRSELKNLDPFLMLDDFSVSLIKILEATRVILWDVQEEG